MNQKELNKAANAYLPDYKGYKAVLHPYEIKGIFHSELLMLITIANELKVKKIIESGRARGQSTELIARFAEDMEIEFHSIESNLSSVDADIASNRMKGLNYTFHFGNSVDIMPHLVSDSTLILIDGPKGSGMWNLFKLMITMPGVVGVCMHDSYEGSTIRNNLEKEYKGKYLISDDPEFVELFKHLDEECWQVNPWGPYEIGSYIQGKVFNLHKIKSYSGTLSFVEEKK